MPFIERIKSSLGIDNAELTNPDTAQTHALQKMTDALRANDTFHDLSERTGHSLEEMLELFIQSGTTADGKLYVTAGDNQYFGRRFEVIIDQKSKKCLYRTAEHPTPEMCSLFELPSIMKKIITEIKSFVFPLPEKQTPIDPNTVN